MEHIRIWEANNPSHRQNLPHILHNKVISLHYIYTSPLKPDKSNPWHPMLFFKIYFNINLASTTWSSKHSFFKSDISWVPLIMIQSAKLHKFSFLFRRTLNALGSIPVRLSPVLPEGFRFSLHSLQTLSSKNWSGPLRNS